MAEHILQTKDLCKTYGKQRVLDHVNIDVKQGDIYGFIGLNGAGKSTFMRLVMGLARPSSGSMELFGACSEKELNKIRSRIGALIESPALFPNMTAEQNLEVIRLERGIPGKACIGEALKKVGLENTRKKKTKAFSLGMKQRLGIAIALMGDPDFLVLDEPTNGLDPMGVVEIRELLKNINQEYGVTILISSHILSEVHQIATRIGVIHEGKLLEELTAKELDEKCRTHIHIKADHANQAATVLESELQTTRFEVMPDGSIRLYSHLDNSQAVAKALTDNGLYLEQFTVKTDTLEDYFTGLIGEVPKHV